MSEDLPQVMKELKIRLRRDREEAYQNNIVKLQEKKYNEKHLKRERKLENKRNANPELAVTTRQRKRKAETVFEDGSNSEESVRPKPKKVANNEIGTGKPIAKVKLVQKSATLLRKKGSGTKINKQLDLKRRKAAERKQKQRL